MDDSERDELVWMIQIAMFFETTALALLDMALVADGVSDAEKNFAIGLIRIAGASAATAESVLALTWVADGVSDTEANFTLGLIRIAEASAATAESVLALTWISDGVSDIEADVALGLGNIALTDTEAALQVMDMPFLQTLEEADAAALNSLRGMDSDQLADILSRPMLKDGITDDEAPIVSMLGRNSDVDDKLLDPDATMVERRTVDLSLVGEVDLVIVQTRPGERRSMDLLENAIREAESLMGEPLPTRYVGVLYDENAASGSSVATNFGTHIGISSRGSGPLAHEVSHYYWRGNADWIDEGMAELMESAILHGHVGTPLTADACPFARSLKALDALAPEQGEPAFICNYWLGEGLFVSLFYTLGEDAFWEGARSLYAASRGAVIGIEEVRQAFGPDAEDVIARWYEGE